MAGTVFISQNSLDRLQHRCLVSKDKDDAPVENQSLVKKSYDLVRCHHSRCTKCNDLILPKLHLKYKNTFIYCVCVLGCKFQEAGCACVMTHDWMAEDNL